MSDWQAEIRDGYEIKKKKVERMSMSLAFLGIMVTLWSTYITVNFKSDFMDALILILSVIFSIAFIICLYVTIMVYRMEDKLPNLEELIKSIEKRTE